MKSLFLSSLLLVSPLYGVSENPISSINKVKECLNIQEASYIKELSTLNEFVEGEYKVSKWVTDVKISTYGAYTDEDILEIHKIIDELNELIDDDITISFTENENESNLKVYFIRSSEYKDYFYYVPSSTNWGLFEYYNNYKNEIYKSTVAIDYSVTNQKQRNHLLREEITQSLGLMNDSYKYSDSIFYGNWTETNYYSDFDKKVISKYYSNSILPNMTSKDIDSSVCKNI